MSEKENCGVNALYDVIVCGGGPAGIGAAVAAAKGGARTLIIEQLAHLGGVSSGARVSTWGDSFGGPVFDEIERRLKSIGAAVRKYNPEMHTFKQGRVTFNTEALKGLLSKILLDLNVQIMYLTVAEKAWVENDAVKGVFISNKNGRALIGADVVIDATADAGIAASAGAEFMKGDPSDGRLQHVNYRFVLDGFEIERYNREKPSDEKLLELAADARKNGALHPPAGIFNPSEKNFPFKADAENKLILNTDWEIEKVDCSDADAISRTTAEAQRAAFELVEFCRRNLPGYENCRIEALPAVLGTRESRRVTGKYILREQELLDGRKFEDGITEACFFIDFHDSPPGRTIPYNIEFKKRFSPPKGDWYDIPYRCLVPVKIEHLLVAGRCISTDREVNSSLRVMPTCMYLGTAAGTAAAMSVKEKKAPHLINGASVRTEIGRLSGLQS